jgi:hypothetical protein
MGLNASLLCQENVLNTTHFIIILVFMSAIFCLFFFFFFFFLSTNILNFIMQIKLLASRVQY